jgi:hypothetical protein
MNYDGYFLRALARLRIERRYRVFDDLERVAGNYPHAICARALLSQSHKMISRKSWLSIWL